MVKALGMAGISKSQVSRLCEELDEEVALARAVAGGSLPLRLARCHLYVKARQDGRVASVVAVVIAVGVNGETGEREVLGLDVRPSEDGAFWLTFPRSFWWPAVFMG